MGEWHEVKWTLKEKIAWLWNFGKLPPKIRVRTLTKEQVEEMKVEVVDKVNAQ